MVLQVLLYQEQLVVFQMYQLVTTSNAQGGSEPQTKESIRFNAPLQYSAQDRAVTTSDYETKILELYPNAWFVSAKKVKMKKHQFMVR